MKETLLRPIDSEHVQRVIAVNFDPEFGAPYWLKREREMGINARRDIRTLDEFKQILGLRTEEKAAQYEHDLKSLPVRSFIPLSVLSNGSRTICGETGGTTGLPKRGAFNTNAYWNAMLEATDVELTRAGVPSNVDWLWIGPTGPHAIGRYAIESGEYRGGICHTIDLDTRIIKKYGAEGMTDALNRYLKHIGEQAMPILQSQNVKVLFTTSKILEMLPEVAPVSRLGLEGILHGGTALDPDTHRIFREEVYVGIPMMGVYGSSITGPSLQKPLEKEDNYNMVYIPFQPFLLEEVRGKNGGPVEYGEEGQVVKYRITEDFMIPGLPERDLATRLKPYGSFKDLFPWDWIQNVHSPIVETNKAQEGVY